MIYFLVNPLDIIGDVIMTALRWIMYWLCSMLYQIVIWLYNTFYVLCSARLLNLDVVNTLSKRLGLVLGLVMLFMVIISFIKNLIDPDTLTDKVKGPMNIIKRVLVVIVLFGVSNFAFNGLYYLQNLVIESNLFNKILIPAQVSNEKFGEHIAANMFLSFYTMDENVSKIYPEGTNDDVDKCIANYRTLEERIYLYQDFGMGYKCIGTTANITLDGEEESRFVMDFSPLLSLVAAGFIIYFLFSYCVSVGVRMFQLAFLEILSPIAFVGYLQPKDDNMFTKWLKIYTSTYIDVFLRIAIISFVVFLIGIILGNSSEYSTFWTSVGNPEGWDRRFIKLVMIFALLTFGKKAPDLLKEIFPSGESKLGLGINTPKKMVDNMAGMGAIRGVGGFAIGAAMGAAGNALREGYNAKKALEDGEKLTKKDIAKRVAGGALGGLATGAWAGARAKGLGKSFGASNKAASQQNKRIADWRADGGKSTPDRWKAGIQKRLGLRTDAAKADLKKSQLEAENAAYKSYDSYIDAAEKRAESQILKGVFNKNKHAAEALRQKNMAEIYRQQSANVKRTDFTEDTYYQKIKDTYGIDKNNAVFLDASGNFDESKFTNAVKARYNADTKEDQEKNKHLLSFDAYVNESYESTLKSYADKASEADSIYLNEMKAAKKEYITQEINKVSGGDDVIKQNIDQARGVVKANTNVEGSAFKGVNSNTLVNYDALDKLNAKAKAKTSENNNELADEKIRNEAARADDKYSGGSSK